jgi:UDP:flavonoid glycosyltransferase YjiC (YdhE family)
VIEAIEAVDVDALCTVGSAMNPSSLERLPRGVRVERWVPQSAAIAAADVVISHGGSGTVIGATAAGRPQLVLPIGADQFDNADLVHERGLGLALEPEDVTPESIGRSLRRLIDSVSIRARATAGAAEIAAMPPPDVAVELIEQLV